MACVTVTSLLRTLEIEFLQSQPRPIVVENELISGNKELIESLREKLVSLMEQFDEYRMDGVEAIKVLESKLRDVASKVEDEIEFQVADLYVGKTRLCQMFRQIFLQGKRKLHHTLRQAIEHINHIEKELVKVKNAIDQQGRNMALGVLPKSDEVIIMGDSSQQASHFEDLMVRKHDDFKTIMELLIQRALDQQKVVSIKGMGGIGKTTLAKTLYKDSSIVSYFDVRAWVVASQHHNKRKMLLDLLKSMGNNAESDSDADLALLLRQCLLGQRYLVVIDDIWSEDAWDDVQACFPDNRNGSRVLLTTRLEDVANYTSSNNDFSHQMHLLDQSESWNLFCEKVLLKGAAFETIARPIVEKCNGLPLAIFVVAGLFYKLNTLEEWKSVAKALNSSGTTTIAESCSRILSFSYNHLPHNLKACFLYLGVFPEDYEIYASNLTRLWAAEGLVKAFEDESSEVVAQKHVQELFDRNLILVSKKSSNGRRIKKFRVHDVLHAFCVREAENENLLKVVSGNGLNFHRAGLRWLSIQYLCFDFQVSSLSSENCRSILYFPKDKPPFMYLQHFNLLRVLYTDDMKHKVQQAGKSFRLERPIHLRYLSSSAVEIFNAEPFSLWNIQTLASAPIYSGNISLDFPHLCYFHSYLKQWPSPPIYSELKQWPNPPKFVNLNLKSISGVSSSFCTKELSTKIPYLMKLCIDFPLYSTEVNLAYFQQLERLKVFSSYAHFKCPITDQIALLKNLKKLSFIYTRLLWEEISVLSRLPRLEVLKLGRHVCKGRRWKLSEEEKFCQLIFLKFDGHPLEQWEVSGDNFPKLERLILSTCVNLKEVPSSFVDILTLKSIELRRCLPSLVTSAKQIQEEQHDQGNYDMVVIEKITYPGWNEEEEPANK